MSSSVSDSIYYEDGSITVRNYNFEEENLPSFFSMSGDENWSLTTANKVSGFVSLVSGSITHSKQSCVSLTETALSGSISFYYKTDTESFDKLYFYIDGTEKLSVGGTNSWTKYSADISSVSNVFKWCYIKDSTTSSSSDKVWIDLISLPHNVYSENYEVIEDIDIFSYGDHVCALDNTSKVNCWGKGANYRLGTGNQNSLSQPSTQVQNLSGPIELAVGGSHTCAINSASKIRCWGYGGYGQLGNGSSSSQSSPVSVDVSNPLSIDAGASHTCAVLDNGSVNCWGYGSSGSLGNGSTSDQNSPVSVNNISNAIQVSAGSMHTCAVLDNGSVNCWGSGSRGQLGNGSTSNQTSPVSVNNISNAIQVSAGSNHTCAVLDNGSVNCWGYGSSGR